MIELYFALGVIVGAVVVMAWGIHKLEPDE